MLGMKKENVIQVKSYKFAVRVVNLYKFLTNEKKEFVMSKQVLRSGTAVGALMREAEHAQSKADFVNKSSVALKEANETLFWLELLKDTEYLEQKDFQSIYDDADELVKILVKIVKTSKTKIKNEKQKNND